MPQQVSPSSDISRQASQLASSEQAHKRIIPIIAAASSSGDNNEPSQQHQDINESKPTNSNGTTTSNIKANLNTNSIKSATKLNGLKNRIIQRPPPLILDKVSNFYDNDNQASTTTTTSQSGNATTNKLQQSLPDSILASNLTTFNETNSTTINQQQQQVILNQNNSTANHKFWASLNLNAQSRTRNSLGNRGTIDSNSTTLPQQQNSVIEHPYESSNNSGTAQLGADLIITHRNTSSANACASSLLNSSNKTSSSSAQKQQRPQPLMTKAISFDDERINNELILKPESNDDSKPHDMSNNSEFDDSSTHGGVASETDGGNLIGVDNPTPPASTGAISDSQRGILEEPPVSATSSRPRSNNPFLATDEELLSNLENENSFHKRPASFMAATDSKSLLSQRQHQQTNLSNPNDQLNVGQQQLVQEQFSDLRINNSHTSHIQNQAHHVNNEADNMIINQQQLSVPYDQHDSSMYGKSSIITQQQLQSIYDTYCQDNYINYEPAISLDSESAVRKPPPSAIMQLPHWTEAIYELNNAILDTSSIAGGAENGEFIYIVKSGDIILELDRVKVSGFTLVEFNQLVESKSIHLLNAVQTRHSHGLTVDLKQYLNCSFPKNSRDKELQDLIRENIYRRTIPCTTRPPKEGEVDKIDYHFLNKEQFVEMNNRGMLLECGTFGNHYYGTMKPFSDLNSLSIYGTINQNEAPEDMRQPLNASHPAVGSSIHREALIDHMRASEHPLYENQESLRMNQMRNINPNVVHANKEAQGASHNPATLGNEIGSKLSADISSGLKHQTTNHMDLYDEPLPHGWERVNDQTHGTYYIDHNTQRTQYERPYETELTKGAMGFGFTLVEADSGVLLVRSVIPGGPAQLNGTIRPGDILLSAVGVSVAGLQHTDIARLFSTFAVGDRIRLTFARSTYIVDTNLVPDEYLFINGTNGDLTVAVNSGSYYNYFNQDHSSNYDQNHQILVDQEFEFITVALVRGDQGFGFTISDSVAGQRVRKIQNSETCTNLKQGDILMSLNGHDITKLTHKEVVERLKNFSTGENVTVTVKRKKRFRSKTPMSMHTNCDEYSLDSTPHRKCKTPSLDGLMLRRSSANQSSSRALNETSRVLFESDGQSKLLHPNAWARASNDPSGTQIGIEQPPSNQPYNETYSTMMPIEESGQFKVVQSIYDTNSMTNNELYYNQQLPQPHLIHNMSVPMNSQINRLDAQKLNGLKTPSISNSEGLAGHDNMTSSAIPSETSLPPMKFTNHGGLNQINQYNNFMNNDKLVMMQMQQQRYQQMLQPPVSTIYQHQNPGYHSMPLYSNSDMLETENPLMQVQPNKQDYQYDSLPYNNNFPNDYYANNEEIALQRVQYGYSNNPILDDYHLNSAAALIQPTTTNCIPNVNSYDQQDEYEFHQVDLDRGNKESNWGIRLIGGSEVNRAISIGSIVFGGAAHKNGRLKSGDEIISINDMNVVGATHQHVVELISACSNRASLLVRRKKFGEACEVVLNRSLDEGFGFVIISSGNCALIGRIIEGSPADRCQQLHVKDRIIAVNGRYITPNMQHPEIVNMIKECGSMLRLRIIPADCYTVELIKSSQNDNFGFSMRGGSEYDGTPLYILRVAPNGLAKDLLNVGDQIIEINNISTVGMTHKQAATIIKSSESIVKLKLRRNYVTPPSLLVDSPRALQKYNQVTAEMKTVNSNVTPNYLNDGSATSEQHSSLADELHQQPTINNMVYNQSMPLYAT